MEHFKAHSTKSASSSNTQMSGLPVEQILEKENWSTKSTWQNFMIRILKRIRPLNMLFWKV